MSKKLYSGHTLRQIRSDFGLSQVEFAKKIGLSTAYVNQIENNNRPVTASVLLTINRIFGVDLSAFEQNDLDRVVQLADVQVARMAYQREQAAQKQAALTAQARALWRLPARATRPFLICARRTCPCL